MLMMTINLLIDCTIKGDQYQQTISDLVDMDMFIATHQALEYLFLHPEYTASFKLCTKYIEQCDCEFSVGYGRMVRNYEIRTLQTLLFCLSDNVGVTNIPLFFQIGNSLFEVEVAGLTPDW
jgi:hypothetical protein